VNKSISNFLALARWIAALAVLVTHAGELIQISDIMVAPHDPAFTLGGSWPAFRIRRCWLSSSCRAF
jgi:hypothetical protein